MTGGMGMKMTLNHNPDIESQADTFWDAYWTLDEEWQPVADGRAGHTGAPPASPGEPLILF